MAYLPQDQTDQQGQQAQQAQGQQPTSTAGAGASTAGGSGAGLPASGGPSASSGGFPGIMAYMNANKDQGAGMAGQLGNKVTGDIQGAQQSEQNYNTGWQGQNQGALDQWKTTNDAAYQKYNTDQASNASAYAGARAVPNSAGYDAAYHQYQATPFAPTSAPQTTQYAPDTSGAQNAQNELTALGNGSGVQAMLQAQYGNVPTYTPGMQAFDAAISTAPAQAQAGRLNTAYGATLNALQSPTAPSLAGPGGTYATFDPTTYQSAHPAARYDPAPGSTPNPNRGSAGSTTPQRGSNSSQSGSGPATNAPANTYGSGTDPNSNGWTDISAALNRKNRTSPDRQAS